jgi:hypothetical protein
MATTDNCIPFDLRFFDEFYPLLKGFGPKAKPHLRKAAALGLLQRETFMEQVLADVGGLERSSIYGMDFADKSDAKTVVSVIKNNNTKRGSWMHSMPIHRVVSKEGDLLVIGYNRITDDFHFFRIPHKAYQHVGRTVEIVIESCTLPIGETPNFTGELQPLERGNGLRKWWEYEVPTIHDLFA